MYLIIHFLIILMSPLLHYSLTNKLQEQELRKATYTLLNYTSDNILNGKDSIPRSLLSSAKGSDWSRGRGCVRGRKCGSVRDSVRIEVAFIGKRNGGRSGEVEVGYVGGRGRRRGRKGGVKVQDIATY
jgi:hypothetical protein